MKSKIVKTSYTSVGVSSGVMVNQKQPNHDADYAAFRKAIKENFAAAGNSGDMKLFTTDATGLFDLFLSSIPVQYRQVHNCRTCAKFFDSIGSLVMIDSETGKVTSPVWELSTIPDFYLPGVDAIRRKVEKAKVTGVYYAEDVILGTPVTSDHRNPWQKWEHISVLPPQSIMANSRILTAFQMTAERQQDFETMERALVEFSMDTVSTAVTLLKSNSLYRSEKVLGPGEWLLTLMQRLKKQRGKARKENILWKAVATAPAGFTHPRSSMIGTLLDDIQSGMDFSLVSKRFAEKMDPTKYSRPQAAPKAGNIAQSEKIFKQLEAAGSLRRRYARLDELQLIWSPRKEVAKAKGPAIKGSGIFSHLNQPQKPHPVKVPPQRMTWEKFQRVVMPMAAEMHLVVPTEGSFIGLVTAADKFSPPILQWDFDDARNPVSWYVYASMSNANQWGLRSHTKVKITGITNQPSMWGRPTPNQGASAILVLDGCYDTRNPTLCLFPEILRSDFHSVRSTIEAYSRTRTIEGRLGASACGMRIETNKPQNHEIVVTDLHGNELSYIIDRWD